MKNWHKLMILFIALNVAMLIVILLAITVHGIWDWLRSFVILAVLLLNIYYSEVLRKSTRWTLTLETTSGPADILTSPDGLYLSKVRRAINKAIKVRVIVLTTA